MGQVKTKFYNYLESLVNSFCEQGIVEPDQGLEILTEYSFDEQKAWLSWAEGEIAKGEARAEEECNGVS